jgi:PTH1 family peptidyl-tRNA hydrolase
MNILIVGLGNPSKRWTPHNIGSDLLRLAFSFQDKTFKIDNICFLVEPDYMNISGPAIMRFMKKCAADHLVIVVDDIDTSVGKVVESFGRSHRGHNGIKSILSVYNNDFWKVRIGVGREGDPAEFVLCPIKDLNPFFSCVPIVREKILLIIQKIYDGKDLQV